MGKGQDFEREFCKLLSLWISNGLEDDHFWRTSGSGARATVRRKKGMDTKHQKGDVAPVTEFAKKFLTDNDVIELKTGYRYLTIRDFFTVSNTLVDWLIKLSKETDSWMLVHRNRRTTAFVSAEFLNKFSTPIRIPYFIWKNYDVCKYSIYVFDFNDLLTYSTFLVTEE